MVVDPGRYENPLGDLELLGLRVAGDLDHLHAVPQHRRNPVEHVRGGDEEHFRQVEGHVHVEVVEGGAPRRLERVEQRHARRRAHLVDLVEEEHGIPRADLLQLPDDGPGLRRGIVAARAADVGDLVQAGARHLREPAAEGPGDARRQRGLAHARRPDEAEDLPPRVTLSTAHGQVFEDAPLRFPQADMPFVQDPPGAVDIRRFRLAAAPRQVGQHEEVLPGLRGGVRRQLVELGSQPVQHLSGHAARLDPAAESVGRVVQLRLDVTEPVLEKPAAEGVVPPALQYLLPALPIRLQAAIVGLLGARPVEYVDDERVQRAHAFARIEDVEPLLLEPDRNVEVGDAPDQADRDEIRGHVDGQGGFLPRLRGRAVERRRDVAVLPSPELDRLECVQQVGPRKGVDARRPFEQLHEVVPDFPVVGAVVEDRVCGVATGRSAALIAYQQAREGLQRHAGRLREAGSAERADPSGNIGIPVRRPVEPAAEPEDPRFGRRVRFRPVACLLDEPHQRVRRGHGQRDHLAREQHHVGEIERREPRHVGPRAEQLMVER